MVFSRRVLVLLEGSIPGNRSLHHSTQAGEDGHCCKTIYPTTPPFIPVILDRKFTLNILCVAHFNMKCDSDPCSLVFPLTPFIFHSFFLAFHLSLRLVFQFLRFHFPSLVFLNSSPIYLLFFNAFDFFHPLHSLYFFSFSPRPLILNSL